MTLKETRLLKRLIKEKLEVFGNCKCLSLGFEKCPCALCQLGRMDTKKMQRAVNARMKEGYTGEETRDELFGSNYIYKYTY